MRRPNQAFLEAFEPQNMKKNKRKEKRNVEKEFVKIIYRKLIPFPDNPHHVGAEFYWRSLRIELVKNA